MENYEVIKSKICRLNPYTEDCIDADISIICRDGLCGLMHTTKIEGSNCDSRDEDIILPLEYENLFFMDVDEYHYVVMVERGKQGIFSLNYRGGCVYVNQLLPPIYDRIDLSEENGVMFLHDKGAVTCFSAYYDRVFVKCDRYKVLCSEYILCTKGTVHSLWYTPDTRLVCHPQTDNISFLGYYEHGLWREGEVFILVHEKQEQKHALRQLLFCGGDRKGVHLSPMATDISACMKNYGSFNQLTQIDMSFRSRGDILTAETVDDITGETRDF